MNHFDPLNDPKIKTIELPTIPVPERTFEVVSHSLQIDPDQDPDLEQIRHYLAEVASARLGRLEFHYHNKPWFMVKHGQNYAFDKLGIFHLSPTALISEGYYEPVAEFTQLVSAIERKIARAMQQIRTLNDMLAAHKLK